MKQIGMIVVEGVVPVRASKLDDVRGQIWSYAMDQRAFGPRKLWVVFADRDGHFRGLAYTDRRQPLLHSFSACVDHMGRGAAAAVALCDEPVATGPLSDDALDRFDRARDIARDFDVHLVDWISCDDDQFRAVRLKTMIPSEHSDWWDVPGT